MSAPTDLELMMLLDGELDAEQRAEVEAFLAEAGEEESAASRSKLDGMRAVSRVVGSLEWPMAREASTFDVADAVLAALPAADAETKPVETKPIASKKPAAQTKPTAETRLVASKKSVASETPVPMSSAGRPANDNSRAIFGFAIAAAAAAAALFFWGKTGDDTSTSGSSPVAMTAPPAVPAPSIDEPRPPIEPQLLGDVGDATDEPRYGVEVATVDFGARSGAIYYVPGIEDAAGKAAVTTVVWLNDD